MRQPGIPPSRSATTSRVVRWIFRGSLTVGLPSRPTRSAARGNNAVGLVRIGNQIDDDLHVLLQSFRHRIRWRQTGERIGVVGGILEEIFGRRVAGERGIQRQNTKIRGRF